MLVVDGWDGYGWSVGLVVACRMPECAEETGGRELFRKFGR
jgi:hypothetical protein